MRVHAGGGVDVRIALGEADGAFEILGAVAGPDGEEGLDAGLAGAVEHGVAVVVEARAVEMAVRIDEQVLWEHSAGVRRHW